MILKKPGVNLEDASIVNSDIYPNTGQIGSSIVFRPDNGLLVIENTHPLSSSYTRIATLNPFNYKLLKQTSTTSFSSDWTFGWDYDNNRIIAGFESSVYITIMSISDAGETATTLISYYIGNYDNVIGLFRKNNEYYVLQTNGYYHKRDISGNGIGTFIPAPFSTLTSYMCFDGNQKVWFSKSFSGSRDLAIFQITTGVTPLTPIKTVSWPTSTISPNGTTKVPIAADGSTNTLYLMMFNSSNSETLLYTIDTTEIPTTLVLNTNPYNLPANGTSIGVITARVLDQGGFPIKDILCTVQISGTALSGSQLLYTQDITDSSGTSTFQYQAPLVTGTQNFIIKAYG